MSYCKGCNRAKSRAYYQRTRHVQIQRSVAYHRAHPERKAVWDRTYAAAHPEIILRSRRIRESARRARKRNQFIENVDPQIVYAMHGGRCGICGEFIQGDFHVDHVIPLVKGGMHGYVNVQPAHPRCNLRKGGD